MIGPKNIRLERRQVGIAQGVYYVVTGIWPLLSMRSFEAITGPKQDKWLVKTVGALVTVIGGNLALRSEFSRGDDHDRGTNEARRLGLSSALVMAAIDTIYVAKGRIPKVYLLDAVAETAIAIAWLNS